MERSDGNINLAGYFVLTLAVIGIYAIMASCICRKSSFTESFEDEGCYKTSNLPVSGSVKFPMVPGKLGESKSWTISFTFRSKYGSDGSDKVIFQKGSQPNASPKLSLVNNLDKCLSASFKTPGSWGVMSIVPGEKNFPPMSPGYYSTTCSDSNPVNGKFHKFTWVQAEDKQVMYLDGKLWRFSPNSPILLSDGNLKFNRDDFEFSDVLVCGTPIRKHEVDAIHGEENFVEKISSKFRDGTIGLYRHKEHISPTFRDLISVDNHRSGSVEKYAPYYGWHFRVPPYVQKMYYNRPFRRRWWRRRFIYPKFYRSSPLYW